MGRHVKDLLSLLLLLLEGAMRHGNVCYRTDLSRSGANGKSAAWHWCQASKYGSNQESEKLHH
jgi:hypothetical protein